MWAKTKPSSPASVRGSGRISPFRTSAWSVPATSRSLLGRRQVGDGAPPEHLADHGRTLEDRALERLEPVEPRGEHGLDGLGHTDRLDVRQRLQASLALHEHAFLDEHAQHLLEEERVAAGCAPDGVGGILVERAGEILEQLPRVVALQRRQLDRRRSGPRRPQLREVAAGEAADEDRRVASPAREVLDQVEERRLRPLDVVENEQHRPLARKRLEQPAERPVELVAARVWLGATDGLERGGRARSRRRPRPTRIASRSSRRTISTSGQ